MRIVLDTNVLLVSFSRNSDFRIIFDCFLNEKITLCVTTDILMEYEEIISRHMGREVATTVLQLIENAPNVEWIERYFKWHLISQDPDDNKFVDCAIACNAQYIVSNDRHFSVLKTIPFPKVILLNATEFTDILRSPTTFPAL
ncbi:MAG: putative toxin-antitoxin system toxin component, PIN family [Bacteroidetes bacterium]|nr:MAG: putative toxin-antitoxin system toxin component, PIN family [Bacteroidota bacterium]PTM09150.1 MAG: putative toxin-antitoxin system toxin component, PIN family [Bacteroidota bacterium]